MTILVADMNYGLPNDARGLLSQSRVKEVLQYSPESGELRWIDGPHAGLVAGFAHDGHLRIGIDGITYYAHRIVWLYMTREWPESRVDHRDLDGFNNRWENLRQATVSQNKANGRAYRKSSTLPKGVYHCGARYRARITKDGRTISLGVFGTAEAASGAYLARAQKIFGEFARAA
jgi:hypothetical protein